MPEIALFMFIKLLFYYLVYVNMFVNYVEFMCLLILFVKLIIYCDIINFKLLTHFT